jgi:hypothetical protein
MSVRTGSGALTSRLSGAKLRAAGRRGNATQRANARANQTYSDTVPF